MARLATCSLSLCLVLLLGITVSGCPKSEREGEGERGGYAEYYFLTKHAVETALPSYVNILFHVKDAYGKGVDDLETEDFAVIEDEEAVSPTEANMCVRPREEIPYTFYTVVMLDNSLSVGQNIAEIKNAAKGIVEAMTSQQEIAVYVFSEEVILLQDFVGRDERGLLAEAIDSIELGFNSTNLYGAVVSGVARWSDSYGTARVSQGALIMLTDGSDTQGSSSLEAALSARGSKRVYTVGVGAEIEPDVLNQLGNAGSFQLDNYDGLAQTFAEIQLDIESYAGGFYWLHYLSPRRGDLDHTLSLYLIGNGLDQEDGSVDGSFNSYGFYGVQPGIYVNDNIGQSSGITELSLAAGGTDALEAHVYFGVCGVSSQYEWRVEDGNVASVSPANEGSVVLEALQPGLTTVSVEDTANGYSTLVALKVTGGGNLDGESEEGELGASDGGEIPDIEMVWIEPGTFQMGRYPGEQDSSGSEDPQHTVTLSSGFWLGKYEVTQGQWEAVMGYCPSSLFEPRRPVEKVSWNDVQGFIGALNGLTDETYRLPTEAEWEYACRAGTETRFYWGDDPDYTLINDYAWYSENSGSGTHDVGGKAPNAWGLYDMSGNVWEWSSDWYGDYPSGSVTDPEGPSSGSSRLVRGGTWANSDAFCRSAIRYSRFAPDYAESRIGFRVARTP